MTLATQDIIHSHILGNTTSTKLAFTWRLGRHHGWWGSHISEVIWWRWSERRIYASWTPSECLWLLLRLQLVHQIVHHVYSQRWGWIIVFIDRAPASILIAVYKHVQECLERGKRIRAEVNVKNLKLLNIKLHIFIRLLLESNCIVLVRNRLSVLSNHNLRPELGYVVVCAVTSNWTQKLQLCCSDRRVVSISTQILTK